MKRLVKSLVVFVLLSAGIATFAQATTIHFFWWQGCPHCEKEQIFLTELENKYPDIEVKKYEVWYNKDNATLMKDIADYMNISISWVPFTLIGDSYTIWYYDDDVTGKEIENKLLNCINRWCKDIVAEMQSPSSVPVNEPISPEIQQPSKPQISLSPDTNDEEENIEEIGNIYSPIQKIDDTENSLTWDMITTSTVWKIEEIHTRFGNISLKNLSLPAISIVLWVLDGFNPCALWVLLFLISMLLSMGDRKKMWIIGSTFIAASAFVYFLFMIAWLNIILFFWYLLRVKILIGLVALWWGWYSLYEYLKERKETHGGCPVVNTDKKKRVFERIKDIINRKHLVIALWGTIILAFAVNLVELLCSAGLPVIFTRILTLNNLSTMQYYLYIALYIFFFMSEALVVFFISMITLQAVGVTTKFTKWNHLIGGILMVILWLLMLFKPEWLMLG